MIDFLMIATRATKKGVVEIYPKFKMYPKSQDLMIRGGDFYAIWLEEAGLWSTDEQDALRLIDQELDKYAEANKSRYDDQVKVLHMWDSESGMVDSWHKYCQKQMRDSYHMLDEKLLFENSETNKKDYGSKRLPYPLEKGKIDSYEKIISTLYSQEERTKLEWAIGSIVSGDSRQIQKFIVLYGEAGTGKSTVLNIIQQLFEGYYSVFDAKALGSSSNSFALESFKTNPLVAIQHDGDLSRIEDNTRLNSLVSHEEMTVNEKFKSAYSNRFKAFLFMGTNKPVRITDSKSGLLRRLIDVRPSGSKLPVNEYNELMAHIPFELGAIAYHCQEVYLNNKGLYNDYVPINMIETTNDFYNFMVDSYLIFKKDDGTSLKTAWEMYKTYCTDANVPYPYSMRVFKEELKNYFKSFEARGIDANNNRIRQYYSGFRTEKFENHSKRENFKTEKKEYGWDYVEQESVLDKELADCPAQYASTGENEVPLKAWVNVKTKLSDIDTHKTHYVKPPGSHIFVDFDLKNENREKDLQLNFEAASNFPETYGEISKGGSGLHLHYIYTGDVSKLSRYYAPGIEIKVCTGNSSLRRRLSRCNNKPIATISSGLPLKGEDKMVNFTVIKNEKAIRTIIERNLDKEYHADTTSSVNYIYKTLEDAYNAGVQYDVSDMQNAVIAFAAHSTNQAQECIKKVNKMHFKSEEDPVGEDDTPKQFVFFDVEVYPNLFIICWKFDGDNNPVVKMFNPTKDEVAEFAKLAGKIGFNCRRYDNHICYAAMMGYDNEQLFQLSQKIINKEKDTFFSNAYNFSYTDIYDFASAGNKQSLKKFEIDLGIHHQEMGIPWDQPVPKDMWEKVGEYCANDVLATEKTFHYLSSDWDARCILADIAGMTVNDTTNTLTTKIIFGDNKYPQNEFNYRDLSKPVGPEHYEEYCKLFGFDYVFRVFDDKGQPTYETFKPGMELPDGYSILPFFPGYKYSYGKSSYRDVPEVGEGGLVEAEYGMYGAAALLDIASMHPHSVIAECLFGPKFTRAFVNIVEGRVSIKHSAWDEVDHILGGKLKPHIQKIRNEIDPKRAKAMTKSLANALKTAINSVYGLTAAKFDNPFRDPRNVDNIVAKRGALFMINLAGEVRKRGFKVAHIKTDSIKIPDATPEIIKFVQDYGKEYGYTFEHEATYDRMCLVNNAVYIAKYMTAEKCQELYGYVPDECQDHGGEWTATGTQFQVPYVFKTLFSKEPIEFKDMCETKSVQSSIYLDFNENLPADQHKYHFVGKIGQFCPMVAGADAGIMYREAKDKDGNLKYDSVAGTKGYRWFESEIVKNLHLENKIDRSYYDSMCNKAVEAISKYGDYEWFVSEDPYILPVYVFGKPAYQDEVPFDNEEEELPFAM